MKRLMWAALLCGLLLIGVGVTACGQAGGAPDAGAAKLAVHLDHESYCLVREEQEKKLRATDLFVLRQADPEAEPGNVYRVELEPNVAASYPPQGTVKNWQKLAALPGPMEGDFNLAQGLKMHLSEGAKLIDVRTPEEYREGHVPGSVNLSLTELAGRIAEVAPDKKQPVLLYCRSGNRSGQAAEQLVQAGYALVFNLGGIADYQGELEK